MTLLKVSSIIFIASIFVLSGCSKAQKEPNQALTNQDFRTMSDTPSLTFYNYGTDITEADFLDNSSDPLDQKFNYLNHAITLGLMCIQHSNPDVFTALFNEIDLTLNKQKNLYDFADTHPEINSILDSVFNQRFSDFSTYNNSWISYTQANYNYDTTYVPFVAFLNPGNMNKGKTPYISEPFELNEELFTQFDDDYPLWIYENNTDLFSTVNYQSLANIENPIILLRNAFKGDDNRRFLSPYDNVLDGIGYANDHPPAQTMSCNLNPLPQSHQHEDIKHLGVRIDKRYENWGDSEYRVYWARTLAYLPQSNSFTSYGPPSGYAVVYENGFDISKEQVGTTTLVNHFTIFGPYDFNNGYCFDIPAMTSLFEYRNFIVGIFEWDFGAGKKSLGTFYNLSHGLTADFSGRRKYLNEWYFFDPQNNVGYDFSQRNPTPNSESYFSNKGHLVLKRQNH